MPELPAWYAHFYEKGLEYMQPASTFLGSIAISYYAYGLLSVVILIFVYLKFKKMRQRQRIGGKRKRRQKKAYLKNADKNSNINADPLLQQMADDQLLSAKAKGKSTRKNRSTNLDGNSSMHFNNRDSCNTSEMSTKHDEFESQRTGYDQSLLLKSGASSHLNKAFINYDESGSETESDYSES